MDRAELRARGDAPGGLDAVQPRHADVHEQHVWLAAGGDPHRLLAVGGWVETGPSPGGGFRVAARLPLHGRLRGDAAVAEEGVAS